MAVGLKRIPIKCSAYLFESLKHHGRYNVLLQFEEPSSRSYGCWI